MNRFCYINGKFFESKDAVIGIDDLGLQRGYGVFTYGRVVNGKLFHIDDHLERLRKSDPGSMCVI